MRFSVIVPIYKTEQYLPECVEHLLNQTFRDLEIILVDDGSPDGCPAMVDAYAAKDSRVRPVHKPNGGLVSARKAGAEVATGEYIVNVDSDDYIAYDLLEQIDDAIGEKKPDAVLYGLTLFGHGDPVIFDHPLTPGEYVGEQMEYLRSTFLYDAGAPRLNFGNVLSPICGKAIRRELYLPCQKKVPNEVRSGEDMLFTMHLLNIAESVLATEVNGYFYRQNDQSMEHSVSSRDFENIHILYTELEKGMGHRENQISVYVFSRVWAFAVRTAKAFKFGEFRRRMKDPYVKKLFPVLKKARLSKKAPQDHIVFLFLKGRLLWGIYLLANTVFKNKNI